jgi:hypothetical protein
MGVHEDCSFITEIVRNYLEHEMVTSISIVNYY